MFLFFNLYYIKGKDMILSDFLSGQIEDDSNLHEIIPISFNIWEILQDNYHQLTTETIMCKQEHKQKLKLIPLPCQTPNQRSRKLLLRLPDCQSKLEKEKGNLKHCPVELPNKSQEALCCPQNSSYPQLLCLQMIDHHPSLQTLINPIQICIKNWI